MSLIWPCQTRDWEFCPEARLFVHARYQFIETSGRKVGRLSCDSRNVTQFMFLMKQHLVILSVFAFAFLANLAAEPHRNLKAYAPATEGMQRYVIELPELEDESLRKVELIIGKTVPTDGVNRHFFGGKVTREVVQGWGFSYYELKELGPMAGTLMAGPPGGEMVDTFVQVNHNLGLVRYNSKLPLVVYVPDGVEVRYRLWATAAEPTSAEVN